MTTFFQRVEKYQGFRKLNNNIYSNALYKKAVNKAHPNPMRRKFCFSFLENGIRKHQMRNTKLVVCHRVITSQKFAVGNAIDTLCL